ncbi:hypothetical protein ACFWG7_05785 [Streptomyces koyangensis]|uniref:hypothetical protein n=1 Tax=Streptomyces TaxID=1883 RepID=UPI0013C516B9|nr:MULTISPECIES: hypothetical protein [Streptomyces]WTD06899.1 hypothetical protein OH717_32185 [Streptomyces albidoflavus]
MREFTMPGRGRSAPGPRDQLNSFGSQTSLPSGENREFPGSALESRLSAAR